MHTLQHSSAKVQADFLLEAHVVCILLLAILQPCYVGKPRAVSLVARNLSFLQLNGQALNELMTFLKAAASIKQMVH